MRTIAATDATLLPVVDAAQHEPIVIHRHGDDDAVVLAKTEYERLCAIDHLAFLAEHDRWEVEAAAVDHISDDRLAVLLADDEG